MSRKLKEPVFDDDNPEWTKADFAKARPPAEVIPPELPRSVQEHARTAKNANEGCGVYQVEPRGHFAFQSKGTGLAVEDRRRAAQDRQEGRLI